MNENYKPWGSTKYGPIPIPIFIAPRKDIDCQAYTAWRHGRMYICMAEELVKNGARFDRTLLHEFVHVVEALNDHGWLSPADDGNECTLLAQTMEEGLAQLLKNLKQVGTGARKAKKKAKRRAASSR